MKNIYLTQLAVLFLAISCVQKDTDVTVNSKIVHLELDEREFNSSEMYRINVIMTVHDNRAYLQADSLNKLEIVMHNNKNNNTLKHIYSSQDYLSEANFSTQYEVVKYLKENLTLDDIHSYQEVIAFAIKTSYAHNNPGLTLESVKAEEVSLVKTALNAAANCDAESFNMLYGISLIGNGNPQTKDFYDFKDLEHIYSFCDDYTLEYVDIYFEPN